MTAIRFHTFRHVGALCLAVAVISSAAAPLRAQSDGLDFVMLVDVSGSMWEDVKKQPGNDPQRLRWDAVKLVLDLLTDDDRIVILPFNDQCPASILPKGSSKRIPVPGRLEQELRSVNKSERAKLESRILTFIHDMNTTPPSNSNEANVDDGGTGILNALGFAKKILAARREARKAAVILLTDGEEYTTLTRDSPDEKLVETGKWKSDPRIQFFVDNGIPVHTFGLGTTAKMSFLNELAVIAKGGGLHVMENRQLVEAFRTLIWSLRDCFTKKIDLNDPGSLSSKVAGIVDLGILCYEHVGAAESPDGRRTLFAPQPLPKMYWTGAAQFPPQNPLTGKNFPTKLAGGGLGPERPSGYAFYYFDGRQREGDPRGTMFRLADTLTLQFDDSLRQKDVQGFFVKRIPPQFEIKLKESTFFRHEPIPLRVTMENAGRFTSDQFEVTAEMFPPQRPSDRRVATALSAVAPTEFAVQPGEFTAADLPSEGGMIDHYVLKVTVWEKPRGRNSYQYELPTRTIAIKNVVLLKHAPESVVLDRSKSQQQVTLTAVFPFRGELPLRVSRVMPRGADGSPLDRKRFLVPTIPPTIGDDQVTLKDGQLVLGLGLAPNDFPPYGNYEGGTLTFTALPQTNTPLKLQIMSGVNKDGTNYSHVIPFSVRLSAVGLKFSPQPPWPVLSVGPDNGNASLDVAVNPVDPALIGKKLAGTDALTLELIRDPQARPAFSPEELWIQAAGAPVGAARKSQSVPLSKLSDPLQVCFQPDPSRHSNAAELIKMHQVLLRASGPGFLTIEQELSLEVKPPLVDVQPKAAVLLHVIPGAKSPPASFQARLRWLPGGRLPFDVRPPSEIRFDEAPPPAVGQAKSDSVPYSGVPTTVWLTAPKTTDPADSGWQDLDFVLQIPQRMQFGPYAGSAALWFQNEPAARFDIRLVIDAFYAEYPILPQGAKDLFAAFANVEPKRTAQISLVQYFGKPTKATLRVRTELGDKLDPTKLQVNFTGPLSADGGGPFLTNENDPRDFVACPTRGDPYLGPDQRSVHVDLHFDRVVNASPGVPYRIGLSVKYKDDTAQHDLGESQLTLDVKFIEAKNIITARPATGN
jgi:hypothetical protein